MPMLTMRTALALLALVLPVLGLSGCAGHEPASTAPGAKAAPNSAVLAAADATREAGRYAEAQQIYQRLLITSPNLAGARYGAAECALALGQPDGALTLFNGLVTNSEFHARALQGKGLAEFALGQRDAAGQSLREATAADATLWRAWNGLGDLADQQHKSKEAAALYAKALVLHPNSAIIMNNIGYSLLGSGNYTEAIAEFRKALAIEPNNLTVQTNLRLALAASGDYEAALRSAPREQMPTLLNDVGYIALRRGDYAAAERYLTAATDASSTYSPVAAKNLDWLKDQQGAAH